MMPAQFKTVPEVILSTDFKNAPQEHKIVVIQAGWVLTGKVEERDDRYIITEGSVIRRWGTTMGLGQLAICGRTADTVLDAFGRAEVPKLSVLFLIDCEAPV